MLDSSVLEIDSAKEADAIATRIKEIVRLTLRKKGCIVALSGGVDSSVCAALSVKAVGRDKVMGLLLPEKESSDSSGILGHKVAELLGIATETHDITAALEALGCYSHREMAFRNIFPDYQTDWKSKISIPPGYIESDRILFFHLVVHNSAGEELRARIPPREYLQIVAATNYKQRVRKSVEYFHADRLNYAVVGTPNRLEYDQGFFVKNGDGSADLKPIAHLYKTQVYALARHLGIPEEIVNAQPTTDTYSLSQGQDEFYFAVPYEQMDLVLWAYNKGMKASEIAGDLSMKRGQVEKIFRDIELKRRATKPLHTPPILAVPVPEIEG